MIEETRLVPQPLMMPAKAKPAFTLDHASKKIWFHAFLSPFFVAAEIPKTLEWITSMAADH